MKKIILLVLALLVLIGAGVGGYMMFGPKPADHAEEEKKEEKPPRVGPPVYAQIGPMIVPLMGAKNVQQNIMFTVSLEVDDEPTRESVRAQSPRLTDAYVQALYGGLETGQVIDGQILNIPALKAKLQEATDKVLGPGIVHDVLIQSVTQRPVY